MQKLNPKAGASVNSATPANSQAALRKWFHLDSYLSAVDNALQMATPTLIAQPAVFTHHITAQEEGDIVRLVNENSAIPLIGMTRDETFVPIRSGRG
jgi:hypothetical protein